MKRGDLLRHLRRHGCYLASKARRDRPCHEPLSILDLRGLGKDAWREVDASAHVEAERRAWD